VQREMLNDIEVSQILGLSVWTLRAWRSKGNRGPRFLRVGKCCKYPAEALKAYIKNLPTGGGAVVAAGGAPKEQP
jgi:predicted site-specific integrase-resolvase